MLELKGIRISKRGSRIEGEKPHNSRGILTSLRWWARRHLQITSLTIACSTVYSGADQRKHQNSASLSFVRGIHRRPVNFPQKGPVTRKMFPFDDVIMLQTLGYFNCHCDKRSNRIGDLFKQDVYYRWFQHTQIAKLMGPTWGPPGSCRSQMGPMLAPWPLL